MGKKFSGFLVIAGALLGLFFLPFSGQAQNPLPFDLFWKQATLILVNGDTLHGTVNLTLPNDIVRVSKTDGSTDTFMPAEIKLLFVQEPYNAVPFRQSGDLLLEKRVYASYNWNRDKDFGAQKAPALFVVVVPGKQALLLREQKEPVSPANGGPLAGYAITQAMIEAQNGAYTSVTERFYLSVDGNEPKWLRQPKKDLLASYPDKRKQIKKFAKSNGLYFHRIDHLARIVAYINTF